jgi:gamma-glutamylcyclotransferase (GGCT)/AIG2-like uncharacterized protein YtfP
MKETVFVYGTLRKGGSNHHRMAGALKLGAGTVRGRLFHVDWYPGIILDHAGNEIHGEVYVVDAETLAALDEFEGDAYARVRVEVAGTAAHDAWIWEYRMPVEGLREITSGDWFEIEPPR